MSRIDTLVYDDAVEVPQSVRALIGIDHFGGVLYKRKRLWEHVSAAAHRAGFTTRLRLHEPGDRLALADEIATSRADARYVYLTADLVCADEAHLARHLGKAAYGEVDLVVRPDGAAGSSALASLSADAMRQLLTRRTASQRRDWFGDRGSELVALPADGLVSLASADDLVRFLSDTFYTRSFNQIEADARTITKQSHDIEKMRREHDYWYHLPSALQRFVVQPFDFTEGPKGASYRLERMGVPDFAVLWVHGTEAVDGPTFEQFLDAVFDWFDTRPTREASAKASEERARALYVDKVDRRLEQLMKTPEGKRLDQLVRSGTPYTGGVTEIVERYEALLEAEWKRQPPNEPLAVMHGDLCFSNVLFDKRSGLIRFIDPRGAAKETDIWGDAHYDIAKLSHSVLGGYDFANNGLFDVVLDDALGLQLRLDRPPIGEREAAFVQRLERAGFDPVRVRLYEASLFLSMLPLHVDLPRKLAAFVLTAIDILDEVEAARASSRGLARWLGVGRG